MSRRESKPRHSWQFGLNVFTLAMAILMSACQANTVQVVVGTVTPVTVNVPTLPPTAADIGVLAPPGTPDLNTLPLLADHLRQVQAVLSQPVPILLLTDNLTDSQKQAQSLAVQDARFQTNLRDPQTQASLWNEIFGIYPMRDSDITSTTEACRQDTCYRVEMYNYALNLSMMAAVDLTTRTVLGVNELPNTQPDIPPNLTQIAVEIAIRSPEVAQALGYTPGSDAAMMADTKTALNGTHCERSLHLCVAPTFVKGNRALWAIVDLTEGRLVGARWTTVGTTGPAVTEKGLANDVIMRQYCEHNTALGRDGWQLNYMLTSSDGLRISEVRFQGKPILDSAKLVDWHVSYSQKEGFGYSDAVGCPMFSQAAVIAVQPPTTEAILQNGQVVGFALEQDFWSELWPQPCNYYYEQRYEFYLDGRFRPIVTSVGRGCGNDGTYRPVTRISLAVPGTFAEWSGSNWKIWTHEGWQLQSRTPLSPDGYPYRVTDSKGDGFYIEPSRGQFNDGGRGDNAYLYVTLHHPDLDEGDSDMPTIGPCCNTDYHQGPEKFINPTPEAITDSALVIWYVPQLKNDDTPGHQYCWSESVLRNGVYVPQEYPCVSGPLFVPIHPQTPATPSVVDGQGES